jgi:hypothetical protein
MFSVYALLGDTSAPLSDQLLFEQLSAYFARHEQLSLSWNTLPFGRGRQLLLHWPSWTVSVIYEESDSVAKDSGEIQRRLGAAAPYDLSGIRRRIRVVFADDNTREHTDLAVLMLDFLTDIPGAVVFDAQQNKIMDG